MSKKVVIIVVVLFLAGVAVIIMAGRNMVSNNSTGPSNIAGKNQTVSPTPQAMVNSASVADLMKNPPGPGSTKDEIQAFTDRIAKAAVVSPNLDITGCKPNPPVLFLKAHPNFKLINKDSAAHLIEHSRGIHLEALANSQNEVALPGNLSAGTYGYTCDKNLVGIFLVGP